MGDVSKKETDNIPSDEAGWEFDTQDNFGPQDYSKEHSPARGELGN